MKKLFAGLAVAVALVGCGGPDNVTACKNFVEKVKCGTVDITSSVSCDAYKNTTCDISDYFTCLGSHYVCKDGQYDTAELAKLSECSSKATCR